MEYVLLTWSHPVGEYRLVAQTKTRSRDFVFTLRSWYDTLTD